MDTSILHSRIAEYKAKAKNPSSQGMILLFETWFQSIESYLSDVELINFEQDHKIEELQGIINILCDIIIITGNAEKLYSLNLKDKHTLEAIRLLLKSKDRINHKSISAISTLLHINSDRSFKSIRELKEYATRD